MKNFVLAILGVLALAAAGPAQEKAYKLRYFGLSYFQLESPGGKAVVFDPHNVGEIAAPAVRADVICCSHRHLYKVSPGAVEGYKSARVFEGLKPGTKTKPADWNPTDEKVGGFRVRTVNTYHDATDGADHGKNAVFVVEVENLVFCHLGSLGHELTAAQLKAIGPVDVLMVPVGGVDTLNGETAKAVVAAIKPRLFVVPMHYGTPAYDEYLPPDEFLDGQKSVRKLPGHELSIPAGMKAPVAGPTVAVLTAKGK